MKVLIVLATIVQIPEYFSARMVGNFKIVITTDNGPLVQEMMERQSTTVG